MRRGVRYHGHARVGPRIATTALLVGGTAAVVSASKAPNTPASQPVTINNITINKEKDEEK